MVVIFIKFLKGFVSKIMLSKNEEEDAWKKVRNVIENIPEGFSPYLHHLGQHFLVMRRDDDLGIQLSHFSGLEETSQFSNILHIHPSMIHHHMPWSYNKLFKGWLLFPRVEDSSFFAGIGSTAIGLHELV